MCQLPIEAPSNLAVFAFLTVIPATLVAPIHPKATLVLLDEEYEDRWLTCSFDDRVALARPFPSHLLTVGQDGAAGWQHERAGLVCD